MAALAAVTMLSGCWLQPGYDAGNSRYNDLESTLSTANVADLELAWSRSFPDGLGQPIVGGDGRLYVSHRSGQEVVALRADTGATEWTEVLSTMGGGGKYYDWPVAVVGDELWASWMGQQYQGQTLPPLCDAGTVRLDPADGSELGAVLPTSAAPVAVVGDRTALNTWDPVGGALQSCAGATLTEVRDSGSGDLLWQSEVLDAGTPDRPVVAGGRVFTGLLEDGLRVFDLAGCGTPTCLPGHLAFPSGLENAWAMASDGDTLFVSAHGGSGGPSGHQELVAFDVATLSFLWRAPIPLHAEALAVTPAAVFVASIDGSQLLSFDADGCGAATCAPSWTATLPASQYDSLNPPPVAVAGGVVYVGRGGQNDAQGPHGGILAFDAGGCGASACSPIADIDAGAKVNEIVVAGGRVYASIGFSDRDLVAFAAE